MTDLNFCPGEGRRGDRMCYLSEMMAKGYWSDNNEYTGLDDLYEDRSLNGDYSFSDLCETVDAVSRASWNAKVSRQPVERYRLHIGDRVDWCYGTGYIRCRVVSLRPDGTALVKGVQDRIQLLISQINEYEFFMPE